MTHRKFLQYLKSRVFRYRPVPSPPSSRVTGLSFPLALTALSLSLISRASDGTRDDDHVAVSQCQRRAAAGPRSHTARRFLWEVPRWKTRVYEEFYVNHRAMTPSDVRQSCRVWSNIEDFSEVETPCGIRHRPAVSVYPSSLLAGRLFVENPANLDLNFTNFFAKIIGSIVAVPFRNLSQS